MSSTSSSTHTSPSMPPLIDMAEVEVDDEAGLIRDLNLNLNLTPPHIPPLVRLRRLEEQALQLLTRLYPAPQRPQQARQPHRRNTDMAIDETPIPYPETNRLANPPTRFYPLKIPVSHWQLRHYISLSDSTPSTLYYASSKHIYALNTSTNTRTHLATLPFDARCTASGHGWVCVGGEDEGHFASIQLHPNGRRPTVRVERIGEEIVNSISIHRLQGDEGEHLDDIVAVLTNNDQTVRIYSLPEGKETRVKDLPFAINHATLSPDGKMLVAVGDYNQAYFFTREVIGEVPQIPKPHNRLGARDVDWVLTNVVSLHVCESTVGYFTTAWSPSGALVAVGSEGGYITVLDREILERRDVEDDDAIVAVVAGSRADVPSPYPGAIRSMVFSPEPWDLLCWAEDQGRVCIGDLRTGLKSRQVISLDPDSEDGGFERVVVEDAVREVEATEDEDVGAPTRLDDLEEEIMRRYGAADAAAEETQPTSPPPPPLSSVNFATEYIEARRRQRAARQELASRQEQIRGLLDADLQGLTSREQQILETLRTSRQREEARAGNAPSPNITYASAETSRARRYLLEIADEDGVAQLRPRDSRDSQRVAPGAEPVDELLSGLPTLSRIHAATTGAPRSLDYLPPMSDNTPWYTRAGSGLPRPTAGENAASSGSRLPRIRQSTRPEVEAEDPNEPLPPPPPPEDDDDENPWRTIEEHMTSPPARGPLFEGAARARAAPPLPANASSLAHEEARIAQHLRLRTANERRNNTTSRRETGTGIDRQAREAMILTATLAEARAARGETAEERDARLARGPMPLAGIEGRYEALFRNAGVSGRGREGGVRTAGLAISRCGRWVWVACERGIFEVEVRVGRRMFWPALEMK